MEPDTCPRCDGVGQIPDHGGDIFWRAAPRVTCPRCKGRGEVPAR